MQIHYDESAEKDLKRILDNPDIHIGLDVAEGKDRTIEVSYCLRRKDDVIKVDAISFKEV